MTTLINLAGTEGGAVASNDPLGGDFNSASLSATPAEGMGDVEAMFNSRSWLESALSAKGAKITGGGIGCGCADVDIQLDGFNFVVSMRPF